MKEDLGASHRESKVNNKPLTINKMASVSEVVLDVTEALRAEGFRGKGTGT
jgi:hypothetical protein